MSEYFGEMIGTMFLIIMGDGVVANVLLKKSKAENSGWIVITAGWAFGVLIGVNVAILFGGVNAHINPAVTLAMAVAGSFPWDKVPLYALAQCAGGFLGGVVVWLTFYKHWGVTDNATAKLSVFSTVPAIRSAGWNCVTEIVGTIVLIIGIRALSSGVPAAGLGPFLVASLVWGIGISLGGPTGYAINPARDLGPRLFTAIAGWGSQVFTAHDNWWWVPVVGPCIGAVLGGFVYDLLITRLHEKRA